MFFAVIIMVFGLTLAGQGSYALYKNMDDRKPENIPYITIGRVNDKAIVQVNSNIEISCKNKKDNLQEMAQSTPFYLRTV